MVHAKKWTEFGLKRQKRHTGNVSVLWTVLNYVVREAVVLAIVTLVAYAPPLQK